MSTKFATWCAVVGLGVGLAACGNSSGSSDESDSDAGTAAEDSDTVTGFLPPDDTNVRECDPETCESLGADCGPVADGCGELLEWGECGEGSRCGIDSPNVCTELAGLCDPLSEAEACEARECGEVGDGCLGSYDCGTCAADESCGIVGPFLCGKLSETDEENCPAKIVSCEAAGAQCGLVGNGCGGLLDCDEEAGGCGEGELCGVESPNVCGTVPACEPLNPTDACEGKCGIVSNGCGSEVDDGLIDCSACSEGTVCGGSGVPNECAAGTCELLSEADACADVECGVASDGCDGSIDCGSCGADAICLGGFCEPLCERIPQLQQCAGKDCGVVSDGCGGSYDCGSCEAGEACGEFEPFMCDPIAAGGCAELSDAEACAGKECGIAFDGCGSDIAHQVDCAALNGGCTGDEVCGVVEAFQCDDPGAPDCTAAASCQELGWECGMAVDECGNVFDCAAEGFGCNAETEACIGGLEGPAQCRNGTEAGGTCDVCDSIPDCSAEPQRTALSGRVVTPGGTDSDVADQLGVPNAFVYILRNNNEAQLPAISSGIPSTGGGFGTACDRCDEQDLGPVLTSTTTNALGEYRLEGDIPVGEPFVLVVKIGKWRRAQRVTLQASAACETTLISNMWTRLPRHRTDGLAVNIPKIAVSTGKVDAMECVFHKMGLHTAEFAQPGVNGSAAERIHLYRSPNDGGAQLASGFTSAADLYTNQQRAFSYDMLVFDCEANPFEHNVDDAMIREYVNRGGRMFASHWSYTWIYDNGNAAYSAASPFTTGLGPAATWGTGDEATDTAWVSIDRPGAIESKIQNFADWLENEGAATLDSQGRYALSLVEPRDLASRVGAASEEFVYRTPDDVGANNRCRPCFLIASEENCSASSSCSWNSGTDTCGFANDCNTKLQGACMADAACTWNGSSCAFAQDCDSGGVDSSNQAACTARPQCGWDLTSVQQFAFNTPYGAPEEAICGRVAYSGFHVVADAAGYGNAIFPAHCSGNLTSQEKVLLYMLFDLGACVSTEGLTPPLCEPLTVADCPGRCGTIPDGCGGTLNCTQCPEGEVCLPGGICLPPSCQVTTCAAEGATCGEIADGCGGTLECDECPEGQLCGVVTANQCTPTCVPVDEASACEGKCGFISDACNDVHDCGGCPAGLTCVDNECTDQGCDPLSECPAGLDCGVVSDGCDGTVSCGECTPPEVCGGGGESNVCDVPECPPLDCAALNAECGWIGDGCGGSLDCGECPPGQLCGAGGPNRCDGCEPRSCEDAAAECGMIGDGCGGSLDCGECPEGETCGSELPNQCGDGPGCGLRTCEDEDAECGLVGDGCGGLIDCGDCPSDQVCGIETAFQCGDPPDCVPTTCAAEDAECGSLGDGCGGLINCGGCAAGMQCGADAPNQCPEVAR